MGGLAVNVSDIDDRLHSVTLTPAGLILLAERGHFVEISDADIRDKSKADVFAKCLVILQVTWIAAQTILRKATHYPLSPLEIHTFVHAACASVMYILWFHKPLDVQTPTIISKADFEDLTALMLMQNPRLGTTWYSHLDPLEEFTRDRDGPRAEASFLLFNASALSRRDKGCSSCGGHSSPSTTADIEVADKGVPRVIPRTCDSCVNLLKSERQQGETSKVCSSSSPTTSHPLAGIYCEPPPGVQAVCELRSGDFTPEGIGLQPLITGRSHHELYDGMYLPHPKPVLLAQISPTLKERLPKRLPKLTTYEKPAYWHQIDLSLSEKDHKRWKLAGAAFLKELEIHGVSVSDPRNGRYRNFEISELPRFRDSNIRSETINGWPSGWPRLQPLLARRSRNVNWRSTDSGQRRIQWTLWFLASLYGGIHLALWRHDFPTPVESLMWRISAVTLASAPIIVVFLLNAKDVMGFAEYVMVFVPRMVPILALLLYIFARVFIVVESFISLRHVPIGVYEGGFGWSKYIPHL